MYAAGYANLQWLQCKTVHDGLKYALSHQDVDTGVSLDTFNGRRIGAALVDGDFLGHTMQVDGTFQKTLSRSLIPLGSQ